MRYDLPAPGTWGRGLFICVSLFLVFSAEICLVFLSPCSANPALSFFFFSPFPQKTPPCMCVCVCVCVCVCGCVCFLPRRLPAIRF